MLPKVKWISVIFVIVAGATTGLIILLTRTRDVAVTAVKIATTSGVIAATAGTAIIADKPISWNGWLTYLDAAEQEDTQELAGKFKVSLEHDNLRELKRLLTPDDGDETSNAASQNRQAVNALIIALEDPGVDDDTRGQMIRYLQDIYPITSLSAESDLELYSSLMAAQWLFDDVLQTSDYATAMLPYYRNALDSGRYSSETPMLRILAAMASVKGHETKEGRQFIGMCAEHFDPAQMPFSDPYIAIGAKIASMLILAENLDQGMPYTRAMFARIAQDHDNQRADAFLQDDILPAIQRHTDEEVQRQVMIDIWETASQVCSNTVMKKVWDRLSNDLDVPRRISLYRSMLQKYGKLAYPASPRLHIDMDVSVPIEKIIADHLELISCEMEVGGEAPTLNHLIDSLERRNAHDTVIATTEFLWKTFPTSPAGTQAFALWAKSLPGIEEEGRVISVCNDLEASYPDQDIAGCARMILAQGKVSRGQILEALFDIEEDDASGISSDQSVLTLGRVNELIDRYIERQSSFGFATNRDVLLVGLANQLYGVGEYDMASILYWQATRFQSAELLDPGTDIPFDPPGALYEESSEEAAAQAMFWRAMSKYDDPKHTLATDMLLDLTTSHPGSEFSNLAHLFLARRFVSMGARRKAWQHIQLVPSPLMRSGTDRAMLAKLSSDIPEEEEIQARRDRIEEIRKQISRSVNRVGNDRLLKELGDLYLDNQAYEEGVSCYEDIIRNFSNSATCPEVLYRAITIYSSKLPNPERAKKLKHLLQTRYPHSRYAKLLAN